MEKLEGSSSTPCKLRVSENLVTGNMVAVNTEQGWSRAKVLSSKDGKPQLYLRDFGR